MHKGGYPLYRVSAKLLDVDKVRENTKRMEEQGGVMVSGLIKDEFIIAVGDMAVAAE
jgi:hypothetical protein